MMYNTVLIRRWTAFQELGVNSINGPGMYHTSVSLDPGTKIGGYRGVTTPDEPILVHLVRNPNTPQLRSIQFHETSGTVSIASADAEVGATGVDSCHEFPGRAKPGGGGFGWTRHPAPTPRGTP